MATQVTPGRLSTPRAPRAIAVGAGQNRIFAVFALAAVLILTVAVLAIPRANAYIPVTLDEAAVGSEPKLKATMDYSPKDPKPDKGSAITYTARYTSEAQDKANPQSVITITVTQDKNAPFDGAPTLDDLTINSGTGEKTGPVKVGENTWAYTINTSNLKDFDATFTKTATVKKEVEPDKPLPGGTVIVGSTTFDFKPGTNKTGMTEIKKEVVGTNGDICTGYAKYTSKIPADSLGAWLADLKFAVNNDVAILDELPDSIDELLDAPAGARNSIKFTFPAGQENAPDGTPWIDKIRQGAEIRKQDGTKPLYGVDPILDRPGIEFKDSINWKYDPSLWTGVDSWLPTGTQVEVHRGYNYRSCENNIATDGNPSRQNAFGIQYDMGSAKLTESKSASAAFRTPGGVQKAWCTDIGYALKENNMYGLIDLSKMSKSDLAIPKPAPTWNTTLGMSSKFPNAMYYLSGDSTSGPMLQRFDTEKLTTTEVVWDNSAFPKIKSAIGMTIDEGGIAYFFRQGDMSFYRADLNKDNPTAEFLGKLNPSNFYSAASLDISMLGKGKVLYLGGALKDYSAKKFNAYEIDFNGKSSSNPITDADVKKVATVSRAGTDVNNANGLAFAKDGYAYIGDQARNALYRFPLTTGSGENMEYIANSSITKTPLSIGKIVDLGSCYYPYVPDKGFQVQKAAIDPVTGAVLDPGTKSANPVKVGADGRATVHYSILVTNVGESEAEAPAVLDKFSAPSGFTVESMAVTDSEGEETEPVKGNTITINPGKIPGGSVKAYTVTVKLHADSLEAISGAKGECDEMGNGASAGGFFNLVTMEGDKDGSKNNEACIPFEKPKTAHIKLIKRIVDQTGKEYGTPGADFPDSYDPATELGKFTLTASGRESNDGAASTREDRAVDPFTGAPITLVEPDASAPLSAVFGAAQANGIAVDRTEVAIGTYTLGEDFTGPANPEIGSYIQGNPVSTPDGKFELQQSWSCEGTGTAKLDDGRPRVTLAENQDATCTVTNTFIRKNVHIEKQAASPTEDSKHVGATVELKAPEGNLAGPATGEITYKVIVTNDSVTTANSGAVTDKFTMPAGLVPNGDVKVKFVATDNRIERKGGKDTYSIGEFGGDGATLATSIENLGPAGTKSATAVFEITIPVKEDQSDAGEGKTKFQAAKESLAECGETTALDGDKVIPATNDKGVVNEVVLANEYLGYTTEEEKVSRDNRACVPVTRTEIPSEWKVEKAPKAPSDKGKIGQTVTMTETEDKSGYQAVAEYTVKVTNVGKAPSNAPAITDAPKLPAGFTITKIEYGTGDPLTVVDAPYGENFTIPAGAAPTPNGESISYTVKVTGVITKEAAAQAKWETTVGTTGNDKDYGLGECADKPGELGGGHGFYNKVTIDDDKDGEENNESCVPVVPPSARILVEKTDATGNTRLTGAEFTLYASERADGVHYTKGTPVKDGAPIPALTSDLIKELPGGSLAEGDSDLIGRYITPKLDVGKVYFLQETKSPAADETGGFSLLPQPVMFKVTGAGQVIPVNDLGDPIGKDNSGVKVVDDSFYLTSGKITVHDPRLGELPKAGGMGHWTLAGGAGLLIIGSLLMMFRTNPNRRRA